ncbi:DNA translocase FtsK 4TM domain-containing protein, partial [Halocynthiibacter sp.]|uniref:DNA translocase FtsK 4TM domain-containing protein n=1 Tax=Halocynthiibacter sp. TaxID=1979210 RepID=UPI003C4C2411
MASYQIRQRDPLFDSDTQASLEKRGKELLGVAMIIVGLAFVLLLSSFSPSDPSWFVASDAPVQNTLGTPGAAIAGPLYTLVGWGGWGVAIILLGWGARFVTHYGEERAMSRLLFTPVGIALISAYASISVFASSLGNSDLWVHSFGPGGVIGDLISGAVLNVVQGFGGMSVWVNLLSIASAVGMIAMMLYVLGFTRSELGRFGRFLLLGAIVGYAQLRRLFGRGAAKAAATAQSVKQARLDRQQNAEYEAAQAALYAEPSVASQPVAPVQHATQVVRPEEYYQPPQAAPVYEHPYEQEEVIEDLPQEETKQGLFASLLRRTPEPELVQTAPPAFEEPAEDGSDRIKSRISDAIQARRRRVPVLKANTVRPAEPSMRAEPQLSRAPVPTVAPIAAAPVVATPVAAAPSVDMEAMDTSWQAEPEIDDFQDYHDDVIVEDMPDHYSAYQEDDYGEPFDDFAEETPAPIAVDPVPQMAAPMQIPQPPVQKAVVQHAPNKPVQPSRQAQAEAQPALKFDASAETYENPPLSLLASPETIERHHLSDEALEENARMLESVLDDYGVKGEIVSVRPGPVVTMYELEPAPGLKASRVIGLADDIARSMSALSARVSTVPGRSVIGIELPNEKREMVSFREILSGRDFGDGSHSLPLALGKDIGGAPVVANLAK